jgi:hypothetical protein
MQIKLTLLPGQKGTKKLLRQYGDQLVCVRYRYNPELQKRYKTVELIVDESPWVSNETLDTKKNSSTNKTVAVRVGYSETTLRNRIKSAGGKWSQEEKVWLLPYRKAVEFGLGKRIVK